MSATSRKSSDEEHISLSCDVCAQSEGFLIQTVIVSLNTLIIWGKFYGSNLRYQVFSTAVEVKLKFWVRSCPHICLNKYTERLKFNKFLFYKNGWKVITNIFQESCNTAICFYFSLKYHNDFGILYRIARDQIKYRRGPPKPEENSVTRLTWQLWAWISCLSVGTIFNRKRGEEKKINSDILPIYFLLFITVFYIVGFALTVSPDILSMLWALNALNSSDSKGALVKWNNHH